MVSGPTQNTSEDETNASTNRVCEPRALNRYCSQTPRSSSRRSMSASEPMMPPISSEPSTISTGALPPTAAESTDDVTSTADSPPISRVTRPSASVTVSRVRCGSRCPSSSPMAEPMMTVATLTTVPKPGNTSR